MLRVDHRPAVLGETQVRAVERVLRPVATADHAAAAVDAALEVDGDLRWPEGRRHPHPLGDASQHGVGRRLEGNGCCTEQPPHGGVVRSKLGIASGRLCEDVRVHERATTHAGAGKNEGVAKPGQAQDSAHPRRRAQR